MEYSLQEKSYMACAIDGEGCVDIWLNRGRFYPAVRITQTVLGWLEEIQKEWGGNICDVSSKNPKHAHKWRIVFRGEVLVTVLTEVGPYLRIKRQQAWLALELAERIINQTGTIRTRITREEREYRRTLYGRCRLLNKRGPRGNWI